MLVKNCHALNSPESLSPCISFHHCCVERKRGRIRGCEVLENHRRQSQQSLVACRAASQTLIATGDTTCVADAHRDDGKRFVVRAVRSTAVHRRGFVPLARKIVISALVPHSEVGQQSSLVSVTITSTNPASPNQRTTSACSNPSHRSCCSVRSHSCVWVSASVMISLPPGLSTRLISRMARDGSGAWCSTMFAKTTSTSFVLSGNDLMSPARASNRFPAKCFRASASIRSDESTPITRAPAARAPSAINPVPVPTSATMLDDVIFAAAIAA
jgi:hypothetical protein